MTVGCSSHFDHPTAIARTLYVDAIDRPVAETIIDRLEAPDATMRVAQLRVLGAGRRPGETSDRLVAVKQRYDPTNLFRLNQNLPPTAGLPGQS